MLLALISFVGGIITVLAPCSLPLLPVIVGGAVSDGGVNKRKALTIVSALSISIIIFTLILKASTALIEIPQNTWQIISGAILIIFGLITIFPRLWENKFLARWQSKSNILVGKGSQKNNLTGDIIIGAALGPVFSTCSPTYFILLATILPVSFLLGLIYLLIFTLGVAATLLLIAFLGQKIVKKLRVAANPDGRFRKILGAIFLLVGLMVLTGFDKKIETALLDRGYFDFTKIEQKLLDIDAKRSEEKSTDQNSGEQSSYEKWPAPEISSPDGFVNTGGEEITLAQYVGNSVVLLDIWTYSCINCQRTLPYLNDWYAKYHALGLEIIGLHTPEFAFEHKIENVERAVAQFGIEYPVVLDNDYSTWRSLGNRYWPRKYLIDQNGDITYDHIGEGDYIETEKEIVSALRNLYVEYGDEKLLQQFDGAIKNIQMGLGSANGGGAENSSEEIFIVPDFSNRRISPEIYFGAARNSRLGNGEVGTTGVQNFEANSVDAKKYSFDMIYLGGTWDIQSEYAQVQSVGGSIFFNYFAKNVYMVASGLSAAGGDGIVQGVEIYIDGELSKTIDISTEDLYDIVEHDLRGAHMLEIRVPEGGLQVFTFTFG